ncbi:MAG TPA: hypothetical protein VH186_15165 [Chloroflexia bacterium]|nr:hypothetical protein [Chloroflexia bacterium]
MQADIHGIDRELVDILLPKGLSAWEEIEQLANRVQEICVNRSASGHLEAEENPVNLWRYSLLKVRPVGDATSYPPQLYEALTWLGQADHAVRLAGLLPLTYHKVTALIRIASVLAQVKGQTFPDGRSLPSSPSTYSLALLMLEASRLALVVQDSQYIAPNELIHAILELDKTGNPDTIKDKSSTSAEKSLADKEAWQEIRANTIKAVRQQESIHSRLFSSFELAVAFFSTGYLAEGQEIWQEALELMASQEDLGTHLGRFVVETLVEKNQLELALTLKKSMLPTKGKVRALVLLYEAFLKAGKISQAESVKDEATTIAGHLENNLPMGYALQELALALHTAGKAAEALPLWQQTEVIFRQARENNNSWVEESITDLIFNLAKVGLWDEASRIQASLKVPYWQVKSARELAYLRAISRRGSQAEIEAGWAKAEEATLALSHRNDRAKASRKLVELLVKAGEWERAERLARSITFDDYEKVYALNVIARELLRSGQPEEAFAIANSIGPHPNNRESLAELAAELVRAGYFDLALKLANKKRQFIDPIRALSLIIIELCRAGQEEKARECWSLLERRAFNSFKEEYNAAGVLRELSGLMVLAGQHEKALTVIDQIENSQQKALALIDYARQFELKGIKGHETEQAWKQAEALVYEIEDDWDNPKASMLNNLASSLAECDKLDKANRLWDKALELAVAYPDATFHNHNLAIIAQELLKWGQWQKAETAMRFVWDQSNINRLLEELVDTLLDLKQWQEAERVAGSIEGGLEKARAQASLAKTLAEEGMWEEAERIAGTITDTDPTGLDQQDNLNDTLAELKQKTVASIGELRMRVSASMPPAEGETGQPTAQVEEADILLHWQTSLKQALNEKNNIARFKQGIDIIDEMVQAGYWREAARLVESLPGDANNDRYTDRNHGQARLVSYLCDQGLWEDAWQIAVKIENKILYERAIEEILTACLDAGLAEQALEIWNSSQEKLYIYSSDGNLVNFKTLASMTENLARSGFPQPLLDVIYVSCVKGNKESDLFDPVTYMKPLAETDNWKELGWHLYQGLLWVNSITFQLLKLPDANPVAGPGL